jgi:hypothetical protein
MSKASRDVWGQEEQKTLRWFDEERGELPFKTPARAPSTMGLAGRGCTKSKQQHLISASILRPCAWPQPDVPRALERANGAEKTSTRAQNLITCNDCFFTTCHCASNVLGDALGSIRRGKWLLALTSFITVFVYIAPGTSVIMVFTELTGIIASCHVNAINDRI